MRPKILEGSGKKKLLLTLCVVTRELVEVLVAPTTILLHVHGTIFLLGLLLLLGLGHGRVGRVRRDSPLSFLIRKIKQNKTKQTNKQKTKTNKEQGKKGQILGKQGEKGARERRGEEGETHVFDDGPVIDVVVGEALLGEEVPEELAEVGVVGLVVKAEGAGVVQVDGKLLREALAEGVDLGAELLLADLLVFLLLGRGPQSLPGEHATVEVHQHVPK